MLLRTRKSQAQTRQLGLAEGGSAMLQRLMQEVANYDSDADLEMQKR